MEAVKVVQFKKEMEAYYLRKNDKLLMYIGHNKGTPWKEALHLIVVPKQLRQVVLKTYHNGAMGGHLGFGKTLARIKEKYFWTGISRDVQQHCAQCKVCHLRRGPARRLRHELWRRPAVWAPFHRLSCDYVAVCKSERG